MGHLRQGIDPGQMEVSGRIPSLLRSLARIKLTASQLINFHLTYKVSHLFGDLPQASNTRQGLQAATEALLSHGQGYFPGARQVFPE